MSEPKARINNIAGALLALAAALSAQIIFDETADTERLAFNIISHLDGAGWEIVRVKP